MSRMKLEKKRYESPIGDVELWVPPLGGMEDVISEVVTGDCYRLRALKSQNVDLRYVIDIGAHIGTFAVMVKRLWPDAKLLCFEPDPDLVEACYANAPFATTMRSSVRYDGRNKLFISEHRAGNCMYDPTVNFDDDIPKNYIPIPVPTTKLEPFITSRVDLIKLDCEGSEFDILSTIHRDCIPHIKRICGEYHHIAGFTFIEQIIKLRFPHLTCVCGDFDLTKTIGMFFCDEHPNR